MELTLDELKLMGLIAAHAQKGWYTRGVKHLSTLALKDEDRVKVMLHRFENTGLIETRRGGTGKTDGVRISVSGNKIRISIFKQLFPDIKSVLLSNRQTAI